MEIEACFQHIQESGLATRRMIDGLRAITYEEVINRSRRLHAFLHSHSLQTGDHVAVASLDDVEASTIILGCLRSGFPLLVLDPGAKRVEVMALISKAKIKAVFLDQELADVWNLEDLHDSLPFIWPINKPKKKLISRLLGKKTQTPSGINYPECLNEYTVRQESLPISVPAGCSKILLCTSGTTALPKISQLSYVNLISAARTSSTKMQLDQDMRLLNLLPLTHYDGIMSGLFTTFLNGATLIRLGPFSVPLLPDIFDAIHKYGVTHVLLTPAILALMLRLGKEVIRDAFNAPDVKFVISVAASLPPNVWSEFEEKSGKRVVNVYGLSETGNYIFAGPNDESYRIGSIGKPLDCRVLIVDDYGRKVNASEIGEVLLSGESVMESYLEDPAPKTTIEGVEYFQTGDLGYVDPDGYYWLSGRKKSIIIVGGRNVYPDEINNALLSHPAVAEVVTVGMPDEIWGERIVSCAVLQGAVTSQDLLDHASKHLTDYKIPREIHVLPALPRGRSGKVIVNEVIALLQQGQLQGKKDTTERLEDQVLKLASESFRVSLEELTLETTPQNCSRWDSVAHMDFVMNVETEYGIELLPREIMQITSLESAVRIINEKLAP